MFVGVDATNRAESQSYPTSPKPRIEPVAVAVASHTERKATWFVDFSAEGSYDPDGDALTYRWTFGDGTSSNDKNPSKKWNSLGTKTVTLRVTDSRGDWDETTLQVTIVPNVVPSSRFTASATTITAGESVTFDGSTSSDVDDEFDTLRLNWRLVPSMTEYLPFTLLGTGTVYTHTFTEPGTYTIQLAVNDPYGSTGLSQPRTITVLPAE